MRSFSWNVCAKVGGGAGFRGFLELNLIFSLIIQMYPAPKGAQGSPIEWSSVSANVTGKLRQKW